MDTHNNFGPNKQRLDSVLQSGLNVTSRRALVRLGAGLAVGTLALTGPGTRFAIAQEATPSATPMTADETEAFLREYLDVLASGGDFGQYFAEDIVVTLADVGQEIHGKDPSTQAIVDLHRVAFTAVPEFGPLIVGPGVAALEAVFVGTHTGDFNGIAASNLPVRVPYSVFYGVTGEKITALRIYGLVTGLMLQVTGQLPPVATPVP
jgi:predicted ester cyclase